MIIFLRQCMCKLAGSFSLTLFLLVVSCLSVWADNSQNRVLLYPKIKLSAAANSTQKNWAELDSLALKAEETDRINGISYVISGGIALAGGLVGSNISSDPLERGIYALFQTIGIASIGYGSYKWFIGDEQRLIYKTLRDTPEFSDQQKVIFLKNYQLKKQELEKNERIIKAITHGLIAALNFYNASQQTQDGVKSTLYFVGGANMLASLSYTF